MNDNQPFDYLLHTLECTLENTLSATPKRTPESILSGILGISGVGSTGRGGAAADRSQIGARRHTADWNLGIWNVAASRGPGQDVCSCGIAYVARTIRRHVASNQQVLTVSDCGESRRERYVGQARRETSRPRADGRWSGSGRSTERGNLSTTWLHSIRSADRLPFSRARGSGRLLYYVDG